MESFQLEMKPIKETSFFPEEAPCRKLFWPFFAVHEQDEPRHWQSTAFQVYQIVIYVAAIQLFFVQIDNLEPMPVVRGYSICLAIVFSIEYVLYLFVCVEDPRIAESFPSAVRSRCPRTRIRIATALSPMMLLDVITIISLLPIPERYKGFSSLRLLRVLNLGKIERIFHFFQPLKSVLVEKQMELLATFAISMVLLIVSASVMFCLESPKFGGPNEEFLSIWTSFWWATAALTTVGYGDITPTTTSGRILGAAVAFVGVGLFALPAGIVAAGFQEAFQLKRARRGRSSQLSRSSGSVAGNVSLLVPKERFESLEADVAGIRDDVNRILKYLEKLEVESLRPAVPAR